MSFVYEKQTFFSALDIIGFASFFYIIQSICCFAAALARALGREFLSMREQGVNVLKVIVKGLAVYSAIGNDFGNGDF